MTNNDNGLLSIFKTNWFKDVSNYLSPTSSVQIEEKSGQGETELALPEKTNILNLNPYIRVSYDGITVRNVYYINSVK